MKIDLDLPEFEKEISINIIIRKDGEVVYSTSSPTDNVERKITSEKVLVDKENSGSVKKVTQTKKPAKTDKLVGGGNLMGMDF